MITGLHRAIGRPGRRLSLPLLAAAAAGLLVACTAGDSQNASQPRPPVAVEATVDRTVATVGDRLSYTVTVDRARDLDVEVPALDPELEGLTVIDVGEPKVRKRQDRVIEEHSVRLRVDDVGSYELPPVKVRYRPRSSQDDAAQNAVAKDGGVDGGSAEADEETPEEASEKPWKTVETTPVSVEVESLLERAEAAGEKVTDIRGLKPLERPTPEFPWLPLSAAAVLVAVAAVLLGLWIRRRHAGESGAPPRPAHEVALDRLAALAGLDRSDPAAVHRLHFELSEVLRVYVEARFGLNATDLTTEEIVVALPRLPDLEGGDACAFRRFLVDTDRVKFADHRPAEPEIEATFERARAFVESTRPREEEISADTLETATEGSAEETLAGSGGDREEAA
jgi:hypothetical protein